MGGGRVEVLGAGGLQELHPPVLGAVGGAAQVEAAGCPPGSARAWGAPATRSAIWSLVIVSTGSKRSPSSERGDLDRVAATLADRAA